MQKSIDFSQLKIPVPELIKIYDIDLQEQIYDYLINLDEHNKKAYVIAYEHLGSSFNICRSNGFKDWLKNKNTK